MLPYVEFNEILYEMKIDPSTSSQVIFALELVNSITLIPDTGDGTRKQSVFLNKCFYKIFNQ